MRLYIKLLTYEEQISSAQKNLGVSDNEEGEAPEDFYRDDTETELLLPILESEHFRTCRIEGSKPLINIDDV